MVVAVQELADVVVAVLPEKAAKAVPFAFDEETFVESSGDFVYGLFSNAMCNFRSSDKLPLDSSAIFKFDFFELKFDLIRIE